MKEQLTSCTITIHGNHDGWEWHVVAGFGHNSFKTVEHTQGVAETQRKALDAATWWIPDDRPPVGRPTDQAGIAADLINAIDRSMEGAVSTERPKIGQPLPARVQKAENTPDGACAAVTRKSQRCKVPADPDSEFCHLHRPDGAYQRNLAKDWDAKGAPAKKGPWWHKD
jgi:hypothetical protein